MTADVLVVGAGIAGLALAGRLQNRGISVQVVERAAGLHAAGAGIVLHPNALASLGRLREDVVARGAALAARCRSTPTVGVARCGGIWSGDGWACRSPSTAGC
ncbi:FAD-dependent oxidoreductase [Micromonospora sp. 067-2]|uniref:FAD-dependent oxidoreductase n=1 Tax=Micromonospora sp. 067-2 TaxID=2789270 RepID=UPI00397960A0